MTFWDYLSQVISDNTMKDILLLIIGAIISIVFQQGIHLWNTRGKLKVYYSNYVDTTYKRNAHFCVAEDKVGEKYVCCVLPIQLDFVNTSGRKQVFRAVSAIAMREGKKVAVFNPIIRGRTQKGDDTQYKYYGTPQPSYSFTIGEQECVHTDLLFVHEIKECLAREQCFDEVVLLWNDHKDKQHSKSIIKVEHCWTPGLIDMPNEWTRLC